MVLVFPLFDPAYHFGSAGVEPEVFLKNYIMTLSSWRDKSPYREREC
jgi:hypothetical protein